MKKINPCMPSIAQFFLGKVTKHKSLIKINILAMVFSLEILTLF